jgi:hypothetical protein
VITAETMNQGIWSPLETQLSAILGPPSDALLDPSSCYPILSMGSTINICSVFSKKLFVAYFINVKLAMSSFFCFIHGDFKRISSVNINGVLKLQLTKALKYEF